MDAHEVDEDSISVGRPMALEVVEEGRPVEWQPMGSPFRLDVGVFAPE